MIALLLATLAASPNVASPSINLSGGTPSTASGIVDFVEPSYTSGTAVTKGGPVTVTSAASGMLCPDGSWASLGSNQLRVCSNGAYFGGGGNLASNPDAFTSWSIDQTAGNPTRTADAADAPSGEHTADRVDFPSVSTGKKSLIYGSFTATVAPHTFAVLVRAVSGTPTLYVEWTPDGATFSSSPCTPSTSGWIECSVTRTLTAATWYYAIGVDTADPSQAPQSAGSVYLSHASVVPLPALAPWVATNITTPSVGSMASRSLFSAAHAIEADFTASTWSAGIVRNLLSRGPVGTANSLTLALDASNNLTCDSRDGGNTSKKATKAQSFTASSTHKIRCGWNGSAPEISIDGAVQASTVSGTGTGPAAESATLYIGSGNGAALQPFGGRIDNLKEIGKRRSPTEARWWWSAMDPSKRPNDVRFSAYSFDWTSDPVGADNVRRVSSYLLATLSWQYEALSITAPGYFPDRQLRDISYLYDSQTGTTWLASSAVSSYASGFLASDFAIWKSTDGITLTLAGYVSMAAAGTPTKVWSPEFFVDDDDTVYVVVSANTGAGGTFHYHLLRCSDTSSFLSWSYVGELSGSAFPTKTVQASNDMIDPFMFKESGTYYVLWKGETPDGQGSVDYGQIGIASASSILGPYDTGSSFSVPGPVALKGEGMSAVKMPAGSTYAYRLFFDNFLGTFAGGFSQYTDTDAFSTFTAPAATGLATYNRHATFLIGR